MLFMNSEVLMKAELNLRKIQEFDPAYVVLIVISVGFSI